MKKTSNLKAKRQGSAMLMVLFLILVLTLFASSLYGLSIMNVKESVIFHEKNQAYLIARAGAETIIDQYALLDNTQLNAIFQDIPPGADPKTSAQKGNPYTVSGEIADGTFEAIITKNGRQILIESTGHYKRGKGLSLAQLIDVNRYGITYVREGNINISGSGSGSKMIADIAHYPASRDNKQLNITGQTEINGSAYTHSPAIVQANTSTTKIGSIYTDNSIKLRAGTNSRPGKLTFDGIYTSYPTYVDIFDGELNTPAPGTIIGNEIKRGDNAIGNYPRNVNIRVSKNIITFRYNNTFGYPDGFPILPINYAVFADAGQLSAEPMANYLEPSNLEDTDFPSDSKNGALTEYEYSSANWPQDRIIDRPLRQVKIRLSGGERLELDELNTSELKIEGDGSLKVKKLELKRGNKSKNKIGELKIEDGAKLIVDEGNISISQLTIESKNENPSKLIQGSGTIRVDGKTSIKKSEIQLKMPLYTSDDIKLEEASGLIDGQLKTKGNIDIIGKKQSIEGRQEIKDIIEITGDIYIDQKLNIEEAKLIYRGDIHINNKKNTKEAIIVKKAYIDQLGNDQAKGHILASGPIDITESIVGAKYMKSTNALNIDQNSIVIVAIDLVAPTINLEGDSKLVNYNRIFANTELNISLNSDTAKPELEAKNIYVKNFLASGQAKIHVEEIRNIQNVDADITVMGNAKLDVNDIIARELELSEQSYTKALAISVIEDFTLQNQAELDMKIYEDLTDVNSKNSYSNIIWMDKD